MDKDSFFYESSDFKINQGSKKDKTTKDILQSTRLEREKRKLF